MSARLPLVDLLKALASQAIVLHHLAFYGPMSDAVRPHATALVDGLADWGRLAVQVFLVIGGFLAARALAPQGRAALEHPVGRVIERWQRLVGPYLVALGLALLTAAIGRMLTDHETVPDAPSLLQLLANAALLQDWLGIEALSAGVWYVAIDLQLYALLVGLLWVGHRSGRPALGVAGVVLLGALSLWSINRIPGWDAFGPYFFGSYALGVLAAWAQQGKRWGRAALITLLVLGGVALWLDPRSRIALALATAVLLATRSPGKNLAGLGEHPAIGFLGRISYSVFLVHYPICVLFEAAAARWAPDSAPWAAAGLVLAWLSSLIAGTAFHRWVEAPLGRVRRAKPSAAVRRPSAPPARLASGAIRGH